MIIVQTHAGILILTLSTGTLKAGRRRVEEVTTKKRTEVGTTKGEVFCLRFVLSACFLMAFLFYMYFGKDHFHAQ